MNKKALCLAAVIVGCALVVVFVLTSSFAPLPEATGEMDFAVSGTNDCLRFLNNTVSTVYIPFRTGANENWQLTINATKMPGGANGWTEIYIYKDYWNGGSDHKCSSEDLYPILSNIQSVGSQIRGDTPFIETFGGSSPQSYTVFFIFPPGGQATFHVTYAKV